VIDVAPVARDNPPIRSDRRRDPRTFLIDKNGSIVDQFQTDSRGTARDPARYAASRAKL
jgi:hypothetical protein